MNTKSAPKTLQQGTRPQPVILLGERHLCVCQSGITFFYVLVGETEVNPKVNVVDI